MHITGSSLRVIWACLKKDLKSARSEPLYTLVSIILPLNVLVLMSLLVISGGLAPTAVVMQDAGPLAQQFYAAMSQAHSFVVLQHAVHDFSLNTSGIGINALILAAYALGGLILAVIVVRRSTLAH
jgi:ABC-2 type transport system permease protein